MQELDVQIRLEMLERRAQRLERSLTLAVCGLLAALIALALPAWTRPAAAQDAKGARDVLRTRQLVIVDRNGTARIVIGPVPDPQIRGKREPRRVAGTGIQLNDATGNERGGIGLLDDGSLVVGIDDEAGRERAHLYFIPSRGSGLLLQGGKGKEKISLSFPEGNPAVPRLDMTDQAGRPVAALPSGR